MAQHRQILWPMIDAHPTGVLIKGDIEHPVEGVLNLPMRPDGMTEPCRIRCETAEERARLRCLLPINAAGCFHHADTVQGLPGRTLLDAIELIRDPGASRFLPA